MRNSSIQLLALATIGDQKPSIAKTTLCLYDEKNRELYISTDREIDTDLEKNYKIVVGAVAEADTMIVGVDDRLRFDAEVAKKIGDGLIGLYGEKMNLDTVALDTKFDTKIVVLKNDGGAWNFVEAEQFRSFEVGADGKYALLDRDGNLSWDISQERLVNLLESKAKFKPKAQFSAKSRLVPGISGTKFGVYDPESKMMRYLDFEGNFISGAAVAIPVKNKSGDGYITVARDNAGKKSMVGKISDISEIYEVGGDFYKSLCAAADKVGGAHKAPDQAMNAK